MCRAHVLGNKSENCRLSRNESLQTDYIPSKKWPTSITNDVREIEDVRKRKKATRSKTKGLRCEWMRVRVTQARPNCSKSDMMCGSKNMRWRNKLAVKHFFFHKKFTFHIKEGIFHFICFVVVRVCVCVLRCYRCRHLFIRLRGEFDGINARLGQFINV